MRARLKQAAEEAIILGVKWSLIVALILLTVSWLLGDYKTVRQRALNGQQAFEYLRQQATAKPALATKDTPTP